MPFMIRHDSEAIKHGKEGKEREKAYPSLYSQPLRYVHEDIPSSSIECAGGINMALERSKSCRNMCLLIMVLLFISMVNLSYQSDTILPGQSITPRKGLNPRDPFINSRGGVYELGFFIPCNSTNSYVGIWYKDKPLFPVVWIANGDAPVLSYDIDDASLILTTEGDLQLHVNGRMVWHTNTTTADVNTTRAVLLDSGNFIVGSDGSPNLWESFNYPTDSWFPGAKIGSDVTSGKMVPTVLTSWSDLCDMGSGKFAFGIDQNGSNDLLIWSKAAVVWRIGALDFTKMNQEFKLNITFNFSRTDGVNYATYHTPNNSTLVVMTLYFPGQLSPLLWNEKSARFLKVWTRPDVCNYGDACGSNGICTRNQSPICSCPEGFQPNYLSTELQDYFEGCARINGSQCFKDKDEFIALPNIKMPQNYQSPSNGSAEVCRSACADDCSCSAFSNTTGCHLWYGDLNGMEQLNMTDGETIFLRSDLKKVIDGIVVDEAKKSLWLPIALSTTLLILVVGSVSYYVYRKKIIKEPKDTGQDLQLFDLEMTHKRPRSEVQSNNDLNSGNSNLALPLFSLSSVILVTDNFSLSHKLGEGGFGPVYKGKLHNGQEVAVKRLSKHSDQGLDELINEANLIAKLQHTNLVRLLGCCIQNDEKILIYEYMPNKSLDFYLFDQTKRMLLDWSKRMQIIEGIAQGLLYLHHYSRLRIIHRDLKASNILLDTDMKPKISDFGMARIFRGNQLEVNTNHIVGTIGYMPPEYALEGVFSIKTDIFSFGVLLLEILSGERNTIFCHEECLSLQGYAWKLWTNDTPLELLDPILKTSCNSSMALRCIHVALLCVQEHPDDRPDISDILAMIGNEMNVIEIQPRQPAYIAKRRALEVQPETLNELTYSMMQPR